MNKISKCVKHKIQINYEGYIKNRLIMDFMMEDIIEKMRKSYEELYNKGSEQTILVVLIYDILWGIWDIMYLGYP